MTNFAVNAYKGDGIAKAQNAAKRDTIRPNNMKKYHVKGGTSHASNHVEGYVYFNKSATVASNDTLTLTVVDGT